METSDRQRNSGLKPFILGLAIGAVAAAAVMSFQRPQEAVPPPVQAEKAAPVDCGTTEQKTAEPTVRPGKAPEDYEFYGVLEKAPVTPAIPDAEQTLAPPPTEGGRQAEGAEAGKTVYLQVASFKAAVDADALKARILLAGAPAVVVAMDIPEKGTHYRVRVGPFASQEELAKAKAQLGQGGVDLQHAFVVR
jgi:cell division protein FtsN